MATTFNSWPIIAMPSEPAPKSIEPVFKQIAGVSENPFSGQQQIYDWAAAYMELTVTMPAMTQIDAQPWIDFLIACRGMINVFQIANAKWLAQIPTSANVNGFWRLKQNSAKWSVNDGLLVGLEFQIREAI
jgi:hypothetical protein